MKQETLEEAAVNFALKHFLFPNELFFKMGKCSQNDYLLEEEFGLDNTTKYREILGFIEGAKWQQEHYGLMEIELRHTKRLLASCEQALESRDKQQERMYSEEDLRTAYRWGTTVNHGTKEHFNELIEQFKKKKNEK